MKCECASPEDVPISFRVKGAMLIFKMMCLECKRTYDKSIRQSSTDKIDKMKERMK